MFTNLLLVCVPMIIFGLFMLCAFYMGYKFGKDEPIVGGGDLDILEFAENEDEDEDADEEEG